jgi:predicted TIM-barrel fold metal-dependent hydrolase
MSAFVVNGRYVAISSDGHAGADRMGYRPYLSSRWHDEFDRWAGSYRSPFVDLVQFDAERSWNSDRRQSELESNGVVAEVLFPQTLPPFFSMTFPAAADCERRWAGLQAHNRWLVDFCAMAPGRRAGVAQLMLHDFDAAVAEVCWAHQAGLFGGVLIPAVPLNDPLTAPLYAPVYEPLWSVCEELGVVVHSHGGFISSAWGVDKYPAAGAVYIYEGSAFTHRTLSHLILSGVFERHPMLRLAMVEQGTGWIAGELRALDRLVDAMHSGPDTAVGRYGAAVIGQLRMKPSEYFARNCRVGASFLRRAEVAHRHDIGVDTIMWGADYPHTEGTFPHTIEALRWAFAGIDTEEVALMLAGNAADLYSFDLATLSTRAAQVGPEVALVAQPLADAPADSLSGVFTNLVDFSDEGCDERILVPDS